MVDAEIVSLTISAITLVIIGYLVLRRRTFEEARTTANEIAEIIRAAVFAAEQLKATGKLPDNNAAFDYAYLHAQRLLPNIEKETLRMWIESFVPLASQAIKKNNESEQSGPVAKTQGLL